MLVLEGEDGRLLSLSNLAGAGESLRYLARLTTETAEASVEVLEYNSSLPQFVRDVADAWKGFDGAKEYASIEGHLTLLCEHDGLGTVVCRVTLGQMWEPEWSMSAVLRFGAGAHLERLAGETETFFQGRA